MHDRELDGDDLTGLPDRIEPDDTEVVVDPPPKLIKVSESGRLAGPLANAQGMHDLADAAASGSGRRRWQAKGMAWLLFLGLFGLPLVWLVIEGLSRLF